jgi:O-acetylhomoserine/O-acetylserine sulfhydrylase-like pyridoxal-dependent enzyme
MTMPHPRGHSIQGTRFKVAHIAMATRTPWIRLSAVRQDTTDLIADVHQALDAVIA